ncbi:MAG: SDR family NAD(P)-dependent oxidoreductase [bacterium]
MDLGLSDKVAIVTGGGRGVGLGIALRLAREGCLVAVADIDFAGAKGAAETIESRVDGARAFPIRVDVSDPEGVGAMVRDVVREFGTVHILVNNVGVTLPNWVEEITEDDFERTVEINMRGYVNCTRAVVPYMRSAGYGRLIYLGSSSGLKASAGLALYSASKYFIRGFAISAGLELGRYNITANVICPSDIYPDDFYRTGSWRDDRLIRISLEKEGARDFEELRAKRIAANPMRRACTVEDIADLAAFLASERAGFINAQTIAVNGGGIPT